MYFQNKCFFFFFFTCSCGYSHQVGLSGGCSLCSLLQETISFEVFYYSPDGSVGNWGQEEFCYPVMEVGEGVGGDDVSVRPDLPAALEETQFLRPNHGGDRWALNVDGERWAMTCVCGRWVIACGGDRQTLTGGSAVDIIWYVTFQ